MINGNVPTRMVCSSSRNARRATKDQTQLPATERSNECNDRYWLAKHVYACATQDALVLLDLKRDKYLGLSMEQAYVLNQLVEGLTGDAECGDPAFRTNEAAFGIARQLAEQGLLTNDPRAGKRCAPTGVVHDSTLMALDQQFDDSQAGRVVDVLHFVTACATAALNLRWRGLAYTLNAIEARKERLVTCGRQFDGRRAAELVRLFRRLRLVAFTADGKCLFHAIALANFLAQYGIFPLIVIGVRTAPFGAHAWVQHDRWILDTTPEDVGPYTPLLVV